MRPCKGDSLRQACIVGTHRLGGRSDLVKVVGVIDRRGHGIQHVGKPLESLCGLLDLIVCVSGHNTSFEEPVELGS